MDKNQIKAQEFALGKTAAKMAENYVLAVIRQKLATRQKGNGVTDPILEATRVKAKMGDHRLLGLNFTSNKHAFVQHFGFTGVRYAEQVYLKAARFQKTQTSREPHNVNLKAQNIFKDIYTKSGALEYLLNGLGETRTEAVMAKLSDLVLNLNTKDE